MQNIFSEYKDTIILRKERENFSLLLYLLWIFLSQET